MGQKSIPAALLALIASEDAQTASGSIGGMTVDRTNAPVPDAPVTATPNKSGDFQKCEEAGTAPDASREPALSDLATRVGRLPRRT